MKKLISIFRWTPGACRLQSDPPAQAPGGTGINLQGKWRIVETELGDSEFLDLIGHGYIPFDGNSGGELPSDVSLVSFTAAIRPAVWTSSGEAMTKMEACGYGWAELPRSVAHQRNPYPFWRRFVLHRQTLDLFNGLLKRSSSDHPR